MKRLLITGASGFLGYNICRLARKEYEIFGTVHAHAVEMRGVHLSRLDLTSLAEVTEHIRLIRPHALIHTAASSNPSFCQMNPIDSARINVKASTHIAGLCAQLRIPCLFTSTDLVFDGMHPPYSENAPTSPVNVYGMQKVRAEEGMMLEYPKVTICRMPLMFGDPGPAASSFIQPMVSAMREGRELKLFTDEIRTPVSGGDAARGLLLILRSGASGVIHLGGKERVSRHAFGELLAGVLGIKGARLVPCLQEDVPMAAPRSRDVSLDSSKAFAMGYKPAPLESSLRELAGDL